MWEQHISTRCHSEHTANIQGIIYITLYAIPINFALTTITWQANLPWVFLFLLLLWYNEIMLFNIRKRRLNTFTYDHYRQASLLRWRKLWLTVTGLPVTSQLLSFYRSGVSLTHNCLRKCSLSVIRKRTPTERVMDRFVICTCGILQPDEQWSYQSTEHLLTHSQILNSSCLKSHS